MSMLESLLWGYSGAGGFMAVCLFVVIAISVIEAFFGYKLMRIWIVISGVLVGICIGAIAGGLIGMSISMSAVPIAASVGALIGGILGGMLAYKFWKIGIFLFCFGPCFLALFLLVLMMSEQVGASACVGLVGGIVGGLVAVKLEKPIIIIWTSLFNGLAAGFCSFLLAGGLLGVLVGLVCVVGGFLFQCKSNGNVFGIGNGNLDLSGLSQTMGKARTAAMSAAEKAGNVAGASMEKAATAVKEKKQELSKESEKTAVPTVMAVTGNLQARNSKLRGDLTVARIRTRNERELWAEGVPVVIPQAQIADMDGGTAMGLYLSIQNIGNKQVTAVYFDIRCFNVLKEELAELKDVAFLDLAIDTGKVQPMETCVPLPDPSIRRCELIIKYVVFSDESIWKQDGGISLEPIKEQKEQNLGEGLREEFKKEIYKLTGYRSSEYPYMPEDQKTSWLCGCGQLNTEDRCVCCGIKREDMFACVDEEHLSVLYQKTLERRAREEEERIRQEAERKRLEEERLAQLQREKEAREAERRRKLEELQGKTKNMLGTAVEMGQGLAEKAGTLGKNMAASSPKTRVCPHCGSENEADSMFCGECGESLQQEPRS